MQSFHIQQKMSSTTISCDSNQGHIDCKEKRVCNSVNAEIQMVSFYGSSVVGALRHFVVNQSFAHLSSLLALTAAILCSMLGQQL